MISWRAYWCAAGVITAAVVAALLVFFAVPLFPTLGGLAMTSLLTRGMVQRVVRHADALRHLSDKARQQAAGWVNAGILVHLVWVLLVVMRPDLWQVWAAALAALCAVTYGLCCALRFHFATLQPRIQQQRELEAQREIELAALSEITETTLLEPADDGPLAADTIARQAFELRGYDWLEVLSWTSIMADGEPIGVTYRVRVAATTTGKKNKNTRHELSSADVEPLAIAFSRVLGLELESHWVHITKQPGAGIYLVSVTTVDAMATIYPFVDSQEWTSIKEPALIGYRLGGDELRVCLARHWADTGATRSGKTSLVNVKRGHITRCRDGVMWVGGVEKLFDSVGPWIDPYLGTDLPIPFDAVAHGPQDTAEMLACAMSVGRWRQMQPHRNRTDFMTIFIEIDEASFFLVLTKVGALYQGIKHTPSALACMVVKGLGSAGIYLHLVAQRGTNNNWGDEGGDISANIHTQTVFRTNDPGEVGRATGDWKQPPPVHPGEYLYTEGLGQPVQRIKAPYIQETDPQRDHLHDGATVSDVAWARRHFVRKLDAGSERVARESSEWYRNRATSADAVYAYLTDMVVDLSDAQSPAYGAAYDEATARVAEMLKSAGIGVTDADSGSEGSDAAPDSGPHDNVAQMSGRPKPLKGWVEEIVERAETRLSRQGIIAALVEAGYRDGAPADPQQVTNALNALVKEGRLERDAASTYGPARVSA